MTFRKRSFCTAALWSHLLPTLWHEYLHSPDSQARNLGFDAIIRLLEPGASSEALGRYWDITRSLARTPPVDNEEALQRTLPLEGLVTALRAKLAARLKERARAAAEVLERCEKQILELGEVKESQDVNSTLYTARVQATDEHAVFTRLAECSGRRREYLEDITFADLGEILRIGVIVHNPGVPSEIAGNHGFAAEFGAPRLLRAPPPGRPVVHVGESLSLFLHPNLLVSV